MAFFQALQIVFTGKALWKLLAHGTARPSDRMAAAAHTERHRPVEQFWGVRNLDYGKALVACGARPTNIHFPVAAGPLGPFALLPSCQIHGVSVI